MENGKRSNHVRQEGNDETSDWHDATIRSVSKLTPTVTGLELEMHRTPNKRFSFLPGQWVDFYIPSIDKVGGYSMTSIPSQLPMLQLAVKASQHAPAYWVTYEAKVGDVVRLRVGGNFVYRKSEHVNDTRILLIAGGVGINPIYSMLRQLYETVETNSSGTKTRAVLLYSASDCEELLFESNLVSMETKYPEQFRIHFTVTRQGADQPLSRNEIGHGRISIDLMDGALRWLGDELSAVYICGPPGMAEEMTSTCCDHFGVARNIVHYEKWW